MERKKWLIFIILIFIPALATYNGLKNIQSSYERKSLYLLLVLIPLFAPVAALYLSKYIKRNFGDVMPSSELNLSLLLLTLAFVSLFHNASALIFTKLSFGGWIPGLILIYEVLSGVYITMKFPWTSE
jgi:hypothetical protein